MSKMSNLDYVLKYVKGDLHNYSMALGSRTRLPLTDSDDPHQICVTLQDRELWNEFHKKTNEMIVTKSGR